MATPTWTETLLTTFTSSGISTPVSINTTVATEFDARSKFKVYFIFNIDRTGTTGLTNGADLICRPISGTNVGQGEYVHGEVFHAISQSAASVTTTISGANVASNATTLNVASTTGWAVGDIGILGGSTAREEWVRVSRVTDATHLLIDRGTQYAHTTAQADALFNRGDQFSTQELPGGTQYQLIIDYGDDAAGNSLRIWGSCFSLDSIG